MTPGTQEEPSGHEAVEDGVKDMTSCCFEALSWRSREKCRREICLIHGQHAHSSSVFNWASQRKFRRETSEF